MDEIAHTLKKDPLEFRLSNMKDPRLSRCAAACRGRVRVGQAARAAIAGGFEKGSYVATWLKLRRTKI